MTREIQIEESLITKLSDLKYTYRPDIRDKYSLEKNFRETLIYYFTELCRIVLP